MLRLSILQRYVKCVCVYNTLAFGFVNDCLLNLSKNQFSTFFIITSHCCKKSQVSSIHLHYQISTFYGITFNHVFSSEYFTQNRKREISLFCVNVDNFFCQEWSNLGWKQGWKVSKSYLVSLYTVNFNIWEIHYQANASAYEEEIGTYRFQI